MLLTFIGLVIFSVVFVFSVSNTKYHILCSHYKHEFPYFFNLSLCMTV